MWLTITFVLVALATTLIALIMLTIAWEQHAQEDFSQQQDSVAQMTAKILAQRYEAVGGWTTSTVESMASISAAFEGIGIEVVTSDGTVVYSDFSPDSPQQPIESTATREGSMLSVVVDGVQVGKVFALSLPDADPPYGGNDIRVNTYAAILTAGLVAVTLAALASVFLSRVFTRPLSYIATISNEVRAGNLTARTCMEGSDELSRLGRAVDEMIDAIEKNKKLEHQITTDVAHELRTPLMAMQATIEAMMDGVLPVDAARLATLNSEVVRLGRLVDVQLELSRLESGKTMLRIEDLDLSQLIEDLVIAHQMFIEDAELTFAHEITPGIKVLGDADLLRQAISNLLSNAVRYTPAGGHINIRVCSRRSLAQVFVSDTGIGISNEDIPHVFSRFWRAATGRDRESGGLGVGLALVKEIAMRHQGIVSVESEPGVGSTFTLNLPLFERVGLDERI
ncbi:MAG: HAMP domain-containing protein [Coriobacteriales bacterium]|nr:HAMP domain-containing protein [Coriobacteriales bacterium]